MSAVAVLMPRGFQVRASRHVRRVGIPWRTATMANDQTKPDQKHLEMLNRIPVAPVCGHWPHAGIEQQLATERARAEAAEGQLASFMARRESDGTCTIGCEGPDQENWLEYHSPACMWQQVLNLRAERLAAEGREARLREALIRSRAWLKGAAETFSESTDCQASPRCADWNPTQRLEEGCDSYCERAHDMRRGIVEIDAALAGTP